MSIKITKCIICETEQTEFDAFAERFLSLPDNIRIKKCKRCGLRWLYPMKTIEEYAKIYELGYFDELPEDYEKVVLNRLTIYKERIKKIKRYFKNKEITLLDIGASTGEFVNESFKAGIKAVGIEPSIKACIKAKEKYGIELIQGDFMEVQIEDKFDVIHMHHVFEHMAEPVKCLEKIQSILNENGLFILEVPNQFDNILMNLRILPPKQFSIYSIHHPYFYNSTTISKLLHKHGFIVKKITTWKSYLKGKSGRVPGSEYFFHYFVLFLGDRLFKKGLFVEIYATKRNI